MFAKEIFVEIEGETQDRRDENEWDGIKNHLQSFEARDAFGKIAKTRGDM